MVKVVGSSRRKSRNKMSKRVGQKGKPNITGYMQSFEPGTHVILKADSAYQKGCYHTRFHGRSGVIVGTQGECYKVMITMGKEKKVLLVHPIHLKRE